jgi:hypothetical protein
MLPLEQPKEKEHDAWEVTQARVDCYTKEAAFLFGVEPVEMLVQPVVHIDALESFWNSVQSDAVGLAGMSSAAELIAFPVVQTEAVREVVVILELLFGNWAVRWRRRRLARQEVIHLIIDIWESDIHTSASPIPVLVEFYKLRAFVTPH